MVRDKRIALIAVALSLCTVFLAGCETCAQRGTAVGALVGAGIGQLVGRSPESTLTGAAIGGAGGYMIGNETDKRRARVERAHIREEMRYVAVNITNSNGSISQVRLRKQGVGYVGTRGEYYHRLPTEDQLRPVYGF
jgi:hypothetical protein